MKFTINGDKWFEQMEKLLQATAYTPSTQVHDLFAQERGLAVFNTLFEINKEIFYDKIGVLEKLISLLPNDFDIRCIPPTLFSKDMGSWYLTSDFLSFAQWTQNISPENLKMHNKEFKLTYFYLARTVSQTMKRKSDGMIWKINMSPFPTLWENDKSALAYTAVIDTDKVYDANKVNFHGNNLSQVVFNCGILYDSTRGTVSMHT